MKQIEAEEQEINEAIKEVKKNCYDIDAPALFLGCLKNMKHLPKEGWRKLKHNIEQLLSLAQSEEDKEQARLEKMRREEMEKLND